MKKIKSISKYFRLFILLTFSLYFFACNEEKVIDLGDIEQQFICASDSDNPKLILYEYDKGIISNDIYFEKNGKSLAGKVTKIKEYGGMIFLLIPSKYQIEIINKESFKQIKTIDYSADKLEPTDISFANGTDAYVCFGKDTLLSLLDILNLEHARYIKVGKRPVSIAIAGNQIFIANQQDNSVSIVDSRTHVEEAVISVAHAPNIVGVSNDNTKAVVVSLGKGKLDESQTKSEAKVTFIDIQTRKVRSVINLGTIKTNALIQYPFDMAITSLNYAFIQTKTNLLRLDVKRESSISTLTSVYNKGIFYHNLRNRLIVISSDYKEVRVCSAVNSGKVYSFKLNQEISAVLPL